MVDPLDLIQRFGADSLRFTLAALTMPGSDLKLSEGRTEGYRHFANKIWNASRFALMNLEDFDPAELANDDAPEALSLPDQWIRGRLNQVIQELEDSLDHYAFHEAAHILYQFIWHEFCDWYVELAKLFLYKDVDKRRRVLTQRTLLETLDAILRMLHPFMPFITEEIWQQLPQHKENESIMIAEFPKQDLRFKDPVVRDKMELIIEVITAIRNIRGEMNLPPGEQIVALIRSKSHTTESALKENQSFIQTLARVKTLTFGQNIEKPLHSAFTTVRDAEIFVPMDRSRMEEEAKRLDKEILKVDKEIAFVGKKLSNEQFIARAPSEVVQEERAKAAEYQALRKKLEENLQKIKETLGTP